MSSPAASPQITFQDAVRRGFERYAKFDGRATRAEFWWWFLFTVLVSVVATAVDMTLGLSGLVELVVLLALICPDIAISIRRLHDTNRSGWWLLIGLVPIVGVIVLIVFYVQPGTPGPNDHGPPSL